MQIARGGTMKYKVVSFDTNKKMEVDIPMDVTPMSIMYHPVTKNLTVVGLSMIEEEPEEEPSKEVEEE